MGGERRQYPRLSASLEAQYLLTGNSDWQSAPLHDLSAGGIGLLVDSSCDEVSALERVRFRLPPGGLEFDLEGEVVYCRESSTGGQTVAGVRFTEPDKETVTAIQDYVFAELIGKTSELLSEDEDWAERIEWGEPIQLRYEHFTRFVEEVTENLSLTGMFIRSDEPQPPGSTFEFRFQLNEDFALIQGKAEVIWSREPAPDHNLPCGMGVRFLELTDESRELIARIVRQQTDESEEPTELAALGVAPSPSEAPAERPTPAQTKSTKKLKAHLEHLRTKARKREEGFNAQVEKAAQVLAVLRVRVSELEAEGQSLQHKIERERSSYQEQIETIASNRDQLVSEFDALQNERDRLAEELSIERELSRNLTQEQRDAESRRETLDAKLAEEKARGSELEAELREMRSHLVEAEKKQAQDTDASSELETLRKQVSDLERSLSTSETARKQIQLANQEAHANERAAQKALRDAEERQAAMKRERDDAQSLLDETEKHLSERGAEGDTAAAAAIASQAVPSATGDEADLKTRIRVLEEEQKILIGKLEVSQRNETAANSRLESLETERADLEREAESLRGAAETLDVRLRETQREREAETAQYKQELDTLRAQYEDVEDAPSDSATVGELRQSLAKARRQQKKAETEAERHLEEAKTEAQELRDSLSTTETARRQIAKQAAEASAQEKSMRQQLLQLRQQEQRTEEEEAQSSAKLREVSAQLAAREIELEAANSEVRLLLDDIEHRTERLDEVHKQGRKWPLRAAALVAAGTFAGILAGSVLFSGDGKSGNALPTAVEAAASTTLSVPSAAEAPVAPATERQAAGKTAANDPSRVLPAEAEASAKTAPSSAPAPKTPPSAVVSIEPAVERAIQAWATAWSNKSAEGYLSAYAQSFVPPKGLSRDAWTDQRRNRIEKPEWIRVDVLDLSVTETAAGRAEATFSQKYETPTYRDEVRKTLTLVLQDGSWKIEQETSS